MTEDLSTPPDVLAERARRLARPLEAAERPAGALDMLPFSVGRERYAVAIQFVYAVLRLTDLVPLPGAEAPVVGLTPWRGDALTVLDIRRVAGAAGGALDDLSCAVVLGATAPELGVLADNVHEIVPVDVRRLHPLPGTRLPEIPGLILGITDDATHVLDAAVLLARQVAPAQAGDRETSDLQSP